MNKTMTSEYSKTGEVHFVRAAERLRPYGFDWELEKILAEEEEMIGRFLLALYERMPIADIVSVRPSCLLDYCRAAKRVWERAKELPEEIFFDYVLYHRVNDEKITENRSALQEILLPLLGEDERENVLRINYWCASQLRYQSTDERTMDVRGIWRSGFGRCGEESVFFVSALRSCGIPARQVYSLWWAHTDDNHAWAEVWLDGKWHYAGACEPEEILDKGWFDDAAARSMLVGAKCFSFPRDKEYRGREFRLINRTSRYAQTNLLRLQLLRQGEPLPKDSPVDLLLPNMAGFRKLATLGVGEEGRLEVEVGIGHLLLSVDAGEARALIPVHTEKDSGVSFELSDYTGDSEEWKQMLWKAPFSSARNRKAAPARKDFRHIPKPFPNKETERFVKEQGLEALWEILGEKDRRDISAEILRESVAAPGSSEIPSRIRLHYVENPRVDWEHLSVCREIFRKVFQAEEQICAFTAKVQRTEESLLTSPLYLWRYRAGNERSVQIFIVTALRSLGIPAKLENGVVFRYREGSFIPLSGEATGRLVLEGEIGDFQKTWSLARQTKRGYEVLDAASLRKETDLPAGEYLAVTSLRTAAGDSSLKMKRFTLKAGEEKILSLSFRRVPLQEERMRVLLPEEISSLLPAGEGWRLFVWAQEGAEPTSHLLDELASSDLFLRRVATGLLFSADFSGRDRAVLRLVEKAENLTLCEDLGSEKAELFGRSLFVDPEAFPIVALSHGNTAIYAFSGYQVGSVSLMEQLIKNPEGEEDKDAL